MLKKMHKPKETYNPKETNDPKEARMFKKFVGPRAQAGHLEPVEREFMELLGGAFALYNNAFRAKNLKFEITRGVSQCAGKLNREKGEQMLIKGRREGENHFTVHVGTKRQLKNWSRRAIPAAGGNGTR